MVKVRCVENDPKVKLKVAIISEELCFGCAICIKKCSFDAITIISDLPVNPAKQVVHRYGHRTFKLHMLLTPRPG